jgi:DNA-binding transcriptional MocR family regulator
MFSAVRSSFEHTEDPMALPASTDIVEGLRGRTSAELSAEFADLIHAGALPAGGTLPTIRAVADAVGVSVGTVADAWGSLRERGLIETRRRGGTRVLAPSDSRRFSGWGSVDLLLASPDPRLQPPLDDALLSALRQPGVNAWGREHMVPALRDAVAATWPFEAEAWMSAGGGTEGLWLATRAALPDGGVVAVEEPAPPGYLASLAELGVVVIGVPVDDQGPVPSALRGAVAAGASAFVLQPGGPFSTRSVLTEERIRELVPILRSSEVSVVEDDSLGLLSAVPVRSLGAELPDRTIRVLSYCKSFGLDLRTSVLGGARHLIDRAIAARSGGVASNSRILQHALAAMIGQPHALSVVASARERYARRRRLAIEAFESTGLTVHSGPASMVIWVEVPDERAAAQGLATQGIVVDVAATAFAVSPLQGMLRLSTAQLPEDPALLRELAGLVNRAARGDLRVRFD